MIRVMLAGEGPNELGGWAALPPYRRPDERGVLEALLRCVPAEGWAVERARLWKDRGPRLSTPGGKRQPMPPERKRVLELAQEAREAKCDVLAFARDGDGVAERAREIHAGVSQARAHPPRDGADLRIAGGVAVPTLEGWLLALAGTTKTETFGSSRTAQELLKRGVASKDTVAMRQWVERHGVIAVAPDAESLRDWLSQAGDALGVAPSGSQRQPRGTER